MKQINSLIIVLFLLSIHTTNSQTYNQILVGTDGNGAIFSANLDGSNPLEVNTNLPSWSFYRAIDSPAESKLYMSSNFGIYVMNYDGSNLQQLYHFPPGGIRHGIDIDFTNNKIYFTNPFMETLYNMNMDGTGLTALITGLSSPTDFALDLTNNHIYYCNPYNGVTFGLYRSNMDGTGVTTILYQQDIEVFRIDFINSKIYYSTPVENYVCNLDGTNYTFLFTNNTFSVGDIAIDHTANLLYITNKTDSTVLTSNLDGSNRQTIINNTDIYFNGSPLIQPRGIVLINNSTLGTETVETTANNLVLHPNPSNNFFKISGLKQPKQYSLYNILGIEITNGIVSNNEKIKIDHLKVGLYFLKFKNGNTLKFTKT